MKKVIVSVINDLSTDQRVHKVCTTLHSMGYDVTLVGRRQRNSLPLADRNYRTKRMFLLFEKGPLFYAEFQIRLLVFLFLRNPAVLVSNDLDTLLPNFLVSKFMGSKLVYDSHELFCEVPELKSNPGKRNTWKALEKWIFPKLNYVFTVNDSIAKIYSEEYKVNIRVVRNIPNLSTQENISGVSKEALGIPGQKKIVILQGAGINVDRGAEEAVEAMRYVENAILMIIGSGDVISVLKEIAGRLKLDNKVIFTGKVPFEKLVQYTRHADLGLTLDKDTNINYRYSLPNKLFDYIHSGVPVLASDLVEVKKIIMEYHVGDIVYSHDPKEIGAKINLLLNSERLLPEWKKNCKIAAQKLNWEEEEKVLKEVYKEFLTEV
jgi:glycosyltransferase involved in cell wall biosynthesis